MTTSGDGPKSMRFALHEVLAGMLATIEADGFTDDVTRLAVMFESLAASSPLFAPMAAGVDPAAVGQALMTLDEKGFLQHSAGQYTLTAAGRAHCLNTKRTLFNQKDREELEGAATAFAEL
jgi:hypothetical protein